MSDRFTAAAQDQAEEVGEGLKPMDRALALAAERGLERLPTEFGWRWVPLGDWKRWVAVRDDTVKALVAAGALSLSPRGTVARLTDTGRQMVNGAMKTTSGVPHRVIQDGDRLPCNPGTKAGAIQMWRWVFPDLTDSEAEMLWAVFEGSTIRASSVELWAAQVDAARAASKARRGRAAFIAQARRAR